MINRDPWQISQEQDDPGMIEVMSNHEGHQISQITILFALTDKSLKVAPQNRKGTKFLKKIVDEQGDIFIQLSSSGKLVISICRGLGRSSQEPENSDIIEIKKTNSTFIFGKRRNKFRRWEICYFSIGQASGAVPQKPTEPDTRE